MTFMCARVAVKASDGRYISKDGEEGLKLAVCNDDMDSNVIFYVPAVLQNAFIQTHEREFLSVNDDNELVLLPKTHMLSTKEAFHFICLGMNKVAIQSLNGKYLSTADSDSNQGKLKATATSIGVNETFEVLVLFR